MGNSSNFHRLSKNVQRWVHSQKWEALKGIQENAIAPILEADKDVVISAPTAAGKTEAAFLPACSYLEQSGTTENRGAGILYISPLKALINDQDRRLRSLCEMSNILLTPWHGDALESVKNKFRKNPSGILLITPESMESMLFRKSGWCKEIFQNTGHIIIDEFHSFLGSDRGRQLLSLMHRLEFLTERKIPRIALSATLGEIERVAHFLRPDTKQTPIIIESKTSKSNLELQIRGYVRRLSRQNTEDCEEGFEENRNHCNYPEPSAIAGDLYRLLRGTSNLVFANSRANTEMYAVSLRKACKDNHVPNEFFPHYGNLSKDFRETLEKRLQTGSLPTTAVCTTTLELGIDIGSIDSIAQVGTSPSVSSLRQRVGRSGRRESPARLRIFTTESEIGKDNLVNDLLRLETVQSVAIVNLLLEKWYEPPPSNRPYFSVLVHQTLSVIAQYGGVQANQLWKLLCSTGPFTEVNQKQYKALLKHLGKENILTQTHSGLITLGIRGEKIIEHYTFPAVFQTPEEYRLEHNGKSLGTIPIDPSLIPGQLIVFTGKYWKILSIDAEKRKVVLGKTSGGKIPLFQGDGIPVHDRIREEMKRIYQQKDIPTYLDKTAKDLMIEGTEYFHCLDLEEKYFVSTGGDTYLLPWRGDCITQTLSFLLREQGIEAQSTAGIIKAKNYPVTKVKNAIRSILNKPKPDVLKLACLFPVLKNEKYDWTVPETLQQIEYAARFLDIDGAWETLESLSST